MGELFDDVPVTRKDNPDITEGAQCPGQGRRNGCQSAYPDEVIHFSGDKQNSQEMTSCPNK
jgi:hypothetical protein